MLTLPNPLHGAALARPDAPALSTAAGTVSFRALYGAALRAAAAPWAEGLAPGDVVALQGPADARWVLAWHALGLRGVVIAPLPAATTPGERARLLGACGARALVVTGPEAEAGTHRPPAPAEIARDGATTEVRTFDSQLSELSDRHTPLDTPAPASAAWALEAPRLVVCTSGTTERPRAVTLTAAQLVFSAFGSALRLGHLPSDRWLACLPLHAIGGLSILFRATLGAVPVVLLPAFDAGRIAEALVSGECALVSLLPSMLGDTLHALGGRTVSPLVRAVLVGGAATPAVLVERARAAALPLALTWGMTETASQACTWTPGEFDTPGVGAPLAFARIHADPQGRLRVEGPVAVGGGIESADAGHIDPDGRVHVLRRVDGIVNSGGAKIAPAEVEAILSAHPGVAEAVVVPAPHPRWGMRPVAFVRTRDLGSAPSPLEADALRAHCRASLAPHKCPELFIFVSELPRVATGKVDRRALASRAAQAVGALAEEPA